MGLCYRKIKLNYFKTFQVTKKINFLENALANFTDILDTYRFDVKCELGLVSNAFIKVCKCCAQSWMSSQLQPQFYFWNCAGNMRITLWLINVSEHYFLNCNYWTNKYNTLLMSISYRNMISHQPWIKGGTTHKQG